MRGGRFGVHQILKILSDLSLHVLSDLRILKDLRIFQLVLCDDLRIQCVF